MPDPSVGQDGDSGRLFTEADVVAIARRAVARSHELFLLPGVRDFTVQQVIAECDAVDELTSRGPST